MIYGISPSLTSWNKQQETLGVKEGNDLKWGCCDYTLGFDLNCVNLILLYRLLQSTRAPHISKYHCSSQCSLIGLINIKYTKYFSTLLLILIKKCTSLLQMQTNVGHYIIGPCSSWMTKKKSHWSDSIPLQQSPCDAGDPSLFFSWSKYQRGSCGPDEWRGLERDGAELGYRKPVHTDFLNQSANTESWKQLSSKWSFFSIAHR